MVCHLISAKPLPKALDLFIVNWTLKDKHQGNVNKNTILNKDIWQFVCEMRAMIWNHAYACFSAIYTLTSFLGLRCRILSVIGSIPYHWCLHDWTKKTASNFPDSKAHGANMGPTWGRQDPGGPHVGPMNLAIWVVIPCHSCLLTRIKVTVTHYISTSLQNVFRYVRLKSFDFISSRY